MRNALILSVVAHLGVLVWGLVSLSSASTLKTHEVRPLPVDLVSVAEVDKLRKGTRKAKTIEENPDKSDNAKKATATRQAKAKNKVRRRSANRHRPVSTKTAALAHTTKKKAPPEKAPAEKAKTTEKPVKTTPAKVVKPMRRRPPPKVVKHKKAEKPKKVTRTASANPGRKDFEPDKIRALLNKTRKADGGDKKAAGRKSLGSDSDRDDPHMTQSEIAALRAKLSNCWNPANILDSDQPLPVTVEVELNRDGSLADRPKVTNFIDHPKFQAAIDAARAAVQSCAPFDLPKKKYADWRKFEFTFDLKDSLGG